MRIPLNELRLKYEKNELINLILFILSLCCIFVLGTLFIYKGTHDYIETNDDQRIVAAFEALSEHDLKKAQALFLLADKYGNPDALPYLAWINAKNGNYDRALNYIREAVKYPEISNYYELLGDLALMGYGQAVGAGAAAFYFETGQTAFTQEEIESTNPLAGMYERAFPLARSLEDFQRLVKDGMKAGSSSAYLYQGDMMFLGENNDPSVTDALRYWKQAMNHNIPEALTRVAGVTWYGYGVENDFLGALKLYQEASEAGDMAAEYCLGLISLRTDLNNNYRNALTHFRAAARRGYAPAITAVAILALRRDVNNARIHQAASALFYQAYLKGEHTGGIFYALMHICGLIQNSDEEFGLGILMSLQRGSDCRVVDGILSYISGHTTLEQRRLVYEQLLSLCNSQLSGDLNFHNGAPEINGFALNQQDRKLRRSYNADFKTPDLKLSAVLGNNYVEKYNTPDNVYVNGQKLLFPEMIDILHYYNPTTGAGPFAARKVSSIDAALPRLPDRYRKYEIDIDTLDEFYAKKG